METVGVERFFGISGGGGGGGSYLNPKYVKGDYQASHGSRNTTQDRRVPGYIQLICHGYDR